MARSTKIEAMETRSRILDAAEQVFHANGVSGTSLEEVARVADLTRGAIYWHFKNKGDLFDAMAQRVKLPMEEMVEASADDRETDPLGQMRTSLIFMLQETASNPRSKMVFDIIFLKCEFIDANDMIRSRRQEGARKALINFERVMKNAIRREQLAKNLDVPLACRMLHGMISGMINNWLVMPDALDLEQEAPRLVDACLDMLRYAPSLRR